MFSDSIWDDRNLASNFALILNIAVQVFLAKLLVQTHKDDVRAMWEYRTAMAQPGPSQVPSPAENHVQGYHTLLESLVSKGFLSCDEAGNFSKTNKRRRTSPEEMPTTRDLIEDAVERRIQEKIPGILQQVTPTLVTTLMNTLASNDTLLDLQSRRTALYMFLHMNNAGLLSVMGDTKVALRVSFRNEFLCL